MVLIASSMSLPSSWTCSTYCRPQTIRSSSTPKMVTPAMFSPVAVQCHSLHTIAPSAVRRISCAWKSGNLSNMADQFLRTCSLPPKLPIGVGRLFAPIVRIEAPKKCFEVVAVESFSHPFDDYRHGYRPPFCRRAGRERGRGDHLGRRRGPDCLRPAVCGAGRRGRPGHRRSDEDHNRGKPAGGDGSLE
jgi:hypothetical protein